MATDFTIVVLEAQVEPIPVFSLPIPSSGSLEKEYHIFALLKYMAKKFGVKVVKIKLFKK